MNDKTKGIILTLLLSIAVLFVFYGKILSDPDNYYFSAEGDGFKAYYGAIYHLDHDTSAMRMNGMNYPYGEMVFFTGSQPLVVNTVKFISNHIVDISDHIVAIMNLLMLFSIVLAALFLFLVFFELEVNWLFATFAAIGICMLSPQIARFGGHFSLSWLFWIPMMIYLVIRFDKKPGYMRAVGMAVATFLAGGMHMYFYGFFGFIIGLYLLGQWINPNRKFGFLKGLLFFVISYILPFVIFQLIISANDDVTDRTAYPYGFWAYLGHPVGVFFPAGKPYAFVPKILTVFNRIPWESYAFVGVTGLGGFAAGIVLFVKKILRMTNPFDVSGKFVVNLLFWSSFAALLFSFGIPFILGLEALVDKLGPLRQLRALARFSWFFFYMLNIVVFYGIAQKLKVPKTINRWGIVVLAAFAFLFFDGYWNIRINSRFVQNRKPEMEDRANVSPGNEWVNSIDRDGYQAILPLPYFHVGSENIWIEPRGNIQELAMIASLKTGLPMTGVQLSRTSISQTYKNYALVTEPFEPFEILNELPSEKPFLLLFNRKHYPNEDEARLIRNAELIYQNKDIELRRLPVQKLAGFSESYLAEVKTDFENAVLVERNGYLATDSTAYFKHKGYDEQSSEITYGGEGALKYEAQHWKPVFDDILKAGAGDKFKISFWMYGYKNDGYLRANVELVLRNPETDEVTHYFYSDAHRYIKGFQGDWALIEIGFEATGENESLKVSLRNGTLKNTTLVVDEVLVRKEGVDVYYPSDGPVFKNGRKLPLQL